MTRGIEAPLHLVVAKARSALEALVAGSAVALCDATGSGPLVTSRELAALRRRNLGSRTLDLPLSAGPLTAQIARHHSEGAAETSRRTRAGASPREIVDELVAVLLGVPGLKTA